MRANIGDVLVVAGSESRTGLIIGIVGQDGTPPYVIKWLSDELRLLVRDNDIGIGKPTVAAAWPTWPVAPGNTAARSQWPRPRAAEPNWTGGRRSVRPGRDRAPLRPSFSSH
jgi:Domain of unknown function (DUF1918)